MISQNKNPLILIIGGVLAFVIIIIVIIMSMLPAGPMEKAISDETQMTNFKLENILVDNDPWYLVKTTSTVTNDADGALLVLKKNDAGDYNVVLGPGSNFSTDTLVNTGMAESIIRYLYGDGTLWVGFDELNNTYGSRFLGNTKGLIEKYAGDNFITLRRVTIVQNSMTNRIENERQDNMVTYVNFQFIINDGASDRPALTMSIVGTLTETIGKILDREGSVVSERVYETSY